MARIRLAPLVVLLATMAGLGAPVAAADDKLVVGSLGDSISAGFNALHLGDNRDLSWGTGGNSAIESVAKRLALHQSPPQQLLSVNESIAGAVAADLSRQVTRLTRAELDFVTVTIGANDLCSWGDDHAAALAAFTQTVRTELGRVIAARPTVRIFLAPIPDLGWLREVALAASPSCQTRWNVFGICSPLLGAGSTAAGREAFQQRWMDANDALAQVATEFGDRVIHDPNDRYTRFEWSHLSGLDCFHPSIAGQNLLADKAWASLHE